MGKSSTRAVMVTGGAQGIGRAVAERFLRDGAAVLIADIDVGKAMRSRGEKIPHAGVAVVN